MQRVEDLVTSAAGGDADAWAQLVERFSGLVWSMARSIGLSEADAADVSQTTWMRFAENLEGLRDAAHAGSWLATTAKREAIRVSRLGNRQVPVDPYGWIDQADAFSEDPEIAAISNERILTVQAALSMMPEPCRSLLVALAGDPPATYIDLSARFGMRIGSIGSARSRCLDRLGRLIEDWEDELGVDSAISERTS